ATFLPSVTVDLAEVYEAKQFYRSYVAGLTFLLELVAADSPWPGSQSADFWAAWTPVIIHYEGKPPHFEEQAWQKLFALAYERSRAEFLIALQRWLAERGDFHVPLKRFARLPVASDLE